MVKRKEKKRGSKAGRGRVHIAITEPNVGKLRLLGQKKRRAVKAVANPEQDLPLASTRSLLRSQTFFLQMCPMIQCSHRLRLETLLLSLPR